MEAGSIPPSLAAVESGSLPALLSGLKAWVNPVVLGVLAILAVVFAWLKKTLDTPSRKYNYENPNVGDEYDAWTK